MLVADFVAKVFITNSIDRIFLYPGGTIVPLINSCLAVGIKVECFKSEQGAGYAALAFARITGRPQVVMVTSGPGVTNVVSCLADAYYDSTPLILVTGQIGTGDLKSRLEVRQRGFQETPTVEITKSISKRSTCLMSQEDAFREVPMAFRESRSARKGPIVLDFPMDIQRSEIDEIRASSFVFQKEDGTGPEGAVSFSRVAKEIGEVARQSRRPVILLGHGALDAAAFHSYAEIAKDLNAFVVTSFLGIGSYDTTDPRCIGYIGHTGHLAANRAVYECDFLLVLGSRLDVRQTGTLVKQFVPNGNVAWINSDSTELSNPRVEVKWKVQADVAEFCEIFSLHLKVGENKIDANWKSKILVLKQKRLEDIPQKKCISLPPRTVLECFKNLIGNFGLTVTTGVGCHQHWAARHLDFRPNDRRLLTSGGHGTMGYDLPSAIGVAIAQPERRILCVVGDGSLLMNIQELASLHERNLDVKILVMNNSRLGIVSQFQLITWGSDPTTGNFKSPDFVAIAQGFGVTADRVNNIAELDVKASAFWLASGPALLDVTIDTEADISPMLLAGQTMGEMWMGREA